MTDSRSEAFAQHGGYKSRLKEGRNKGEIESCVHNVMVILTYHSEWSGVLALDEFKHEVVKLKPPPYVDEAEKWEPCEWEEIDTIKTSCWLTEKEEITASNGVINDAVNVVAHENRFHAVKGFLDSLKWDGQKRLGELLAVYFGAPDFEKEDYIKYHYLVSRMWMISAVARMYQPGCKVDHVLILEGYEGLRKSSALALLAGDDWFSDTPFRIGDKDGYQSMRGKWIIELQELETFEQAGPTRSRAFFSSSTDNFRVSYGKKNKDHKRQSVFAGTTNNLEYLMDQNNRRYWPVAVSKIDFEKLKEDRDQLWAEAVHLYKKGVQWWPKEEDIPIFEQQQSLRQVDDPWLGILYGWLLKEGWAGHDEGEKPRLVTLDRIAYECLGLEKERVDIKTSMRIGKLMNRLGWRKRQSSTRHQREVARHYYQKVTPLEQGQ